MTGLVVGIALVGVIVSVLLVVLGRRDQRALWWRAEAHRHAHPETVEPSAQEFASRGPALVAFGILGLLGSAFLGLSTVGDGLVRQADTDAGLDALVRAIEAEPVLVACPVDPPLPCERPRSAVEELARSLPASLLLRVGDQQELGGESREWALDLTTGLDRTPHCLRVEVVGLVTDVSSPARTDDVGGLVVESPAKELGTEARLRAAVAEGPCPA